MVVLFLNNLITTAALPFAPPSFFHAFFFFSFFLCLYICAPLFLHMLPAVGHALHTCFCCCMHSIPPHSSMGARCLLPTIPINMHAFLSPYPHIKLHFQGERQRDLSTGVKNGGGDLFCLDLSGDIYHISGSPV